jgi:hypothetical protein
VQWILSKGNKGAQGFARALFDQDWDQLNNLRSSDQLNTASIPSPVSRPNQRKTANRGVKKNDPLAGQSSASLRDLYAEIEKNTRDDLGTYNNHNFMQAFATKKDEHVAVVASRNRPPFALGENDRTFKVSVQLATIL